MTDETKDQSGLKLAIEYGPLLAFFAVNFLAPEAMMMRLVRPFIGSLDAMNQLAAIVVAKVVVATAVFVVATVVAMIVSKAKLGKISPMLWISGALVLVFGGFTMWFRDPAFIQMKPTIVYLIFAGVLLVGLLTGRPLLERLLGSSYPGLNPRGWRLLTINWTIFFAAMAMLNELVWRTQSWDFWVGFKVWGAIPLTFLFAMANVPMLLKNGLRTGDNETPIPPKG